MSNNNPFSLFVDVENATCVVEFDVIQDEIDYDTCEVFYNKDDGKWILVNDLIHDKTWESIDAQIKAQWADVEEQLGVYNEQY